jgi:23S rRNA (uracil1939-C5)-methyltransferase/tRNA (uracil-5-)-methyltransferase
MVLLMPMKTDFQNKAARIPAKFKAEPFAYHQELELEVATLTNLGEGVARHDGWVIFVPGALPGERIRARI